jgi:hypothetical protein
LTAVLEKIRVQPAIADAVSSCGPGWAGCERAAALPLDSKLIVVGS